MKISNKFLFFLLLLVFLFLLWACKKEEISNPSVEFPDLYSPNAILVNSDTGDVWGEKNSQEKIYPASLTKIMTALLILDYYPDWNQILTVPESIFSSLYAQNASMAGFFPGELASVKDILYGILLPSGADACLTAVYSIAESEESFAAMMNEKAEKLGMSATHFTNATGLQDQDHYSTVEDLSILLRAACKDERFTEIFESTTYTADSASLHPEGLLLTSTLLPALYDFKLSNGSFLGGKTGYTDEAGHCLASLARINNQRYICVTAGAKGTPNVDSYHIQDAFTAYNNLSSAP